MARISALYTVNTKNGYIYYLTLSGTRLKPVLSSGEVATQRSFLSIRYILLSLPTHYLNKFQNLTHIVSNISHSNF